MFITALFTIARTWKQPEWINMLWYVCVYIYIYTHTYIHTYTMEYYSAIKRDEFESILMWWMKLELIYRVK